MSDKPRPQRGNRLNATPEGAPVRETPAQDRPRGHARASAPRVHQTLTPDQYATLERLRDDQRNPKVAAAVAFALVICRRYASMVAEPVISDAQRDGEGRN
jgi:hypothetical protein